jgi:superfamily II DNA or RNA helicase
VDRPYILSHNNTMKSLRDYQKESIKVSLRSSKGIICLPTGSGKTTIQSNIIIEDIKKNPGHQVYLVLAPRIVLSYQLMKEYFRDINDAGIQCWYAGVHSGGKTDINEFEEARNGDIDFQDIQVTTNSFTLREEIAKSQKRDLPIVIFGTYHSADRASTAMGNIPFGTVICDEAHYLVSDQFEDLILVDGLKTNRIIFFTATMQNTSSNSGKGMNNQNRFGRVLLQRTPREMIEAGYMVRPRMHVIRFDQDLDKEELIKSAGRVVEEAFNQHEYISKRTGKIFVTVTGVPMMKSIMESKEIKNLQKRKGASVYAVASDSSIGNDIDGVKYSRQEFLSRLKSDGANPSKEMVILHIDILTEGIDVPGITGILPFRSLKKSKFVQTLGRASRVSPEDLEAFKAGEYTHNDLGEMLKPYAWVMFPDIEGEDTSADIIGLVNELRTYGFNPTEDVFISNERGQMPPVTLMDPLTEADTRSSALQEALEEMRHRIESEEIASLIEGESLEEMFGHF